VRKGISHANLLREAALLQTSSPTCVKSDRIVARTCAGNECDEFVTPHPGSLPSKRSIASGHAWRRAPTSSS